MSARATIVIPRHGMLDTAFKGNDDIEPKWTAMQEKIRGVRPEVDPCTCGLIASSDANSSV